ncbi:MAG: hypothetical protein GY730_11770 [bacterium]|nr:hypothetical protein [bacterium]
MNIYYKIISMNRLHKKKSPPYRPMIRTNYNKLIKEKEILKKYDNSNLKMHLNLDSVVNSFTKQKGEVPLLPDIINIIKKYLDILDAVNKDLLEWCNFIENISILSTNLDITKPISELKLSLNIKGQELCSNFQFKTSMHHEKIFQEICIILNRHYNEDYSKIIRKSKIFLEFSNSNNNSKKYDDKSMLDFTIQDPQVLFDGTCNVSTNSTAMSALVCIDIVNKLSLYVKNNLDNSGKSNYLWLKKDSDNEFCKIVYNIYRFFNVSESLPESLLISPKTSPGISSISSKIKKNIEDKYKNYAIISNPPHLNYMPFSQEKVNGRLQCSYFGLTRDQQLVLSLKIVDGQNIQPISEEEKKYSFNNTVLSSAHMVCSKMFKQSSFYIQFSDLVCIMRNIQNKRKALAL